ncbi:MAG: DNA replication/repair protein RecF [Bacteroidetes bacterium]|nr:DNA replication/repair protein RecF [Bacteroidota bacterium]
MIITKAHLLNFRNHSASAFEFAPAMNVFLGENGQGKTNILEALSFLCITKSFYASADSIVLQRDKNFFEVEGTIEVETGRESAVRVAYDERIKQKKIFINNGEVEKFSEVIGRFPVVILSPENNSITFGAPAERRKFIDLIISQSNRLYAEEMIEYKRILRQRNRILSESDTRLNERELESWNDMLVTFGARIIFKRTQFLREFSPYLMQMYSQLVSEKEIPKLLYAPSVSLEENIPPDEIEILLRKKLEKRRADELRLRTTIVGPHRDECIFSLNGMLLKNYASQGQHKTFLIALKAAEFFYLKERCEETPVFLLDDVFSELDEERSKKLLTLVETLGQTFITTTSENIFGRSPQWNNERKKFLIRSGSVISSIKAA